MFIYNTLSGKKEEVKNTGRTLRLFVCGPTVYDYAHIGHARTYLVFDSIVRYLRYRNFDVFYLQNITDIDDKIIERGKSEKRSPFALVKSFEKKYLEDMKNLGIVSVNEYAPASKFIPEIVRQVQALIKKGYAYEAEDGYYFDISKFKDYGKLAHRTVEAAEDSTSRIDTGKDKINKGDFALWKFVSSKNPTGKKMKIIKGEPAWNTSLGWGRPGWHIEDTAISEKFFGPQYDLHGGAVDLKFPHHEAEIAQQEAASGKHPFVKTWMHTGFLLINGKKMSKSLKNFLTIRDFLKEYPPEVLRWMVLRHHYRSPVNYTNALAEQARTEILKLTDLVNKLNMVIKNNKKIVSSGDMHIHIEKLQRSFHETLDDDFNTPEFMGHLFASEAMYQDKLWGVSAEDAKKLKEFIDSTLDILGIKLKTYKIPRDIQKIANDREKFRGSKQFMQSDALRKKLKGLGYSLEDTPLGPWLKPI
ncbi:MAG: cysteine--tRNA ligase [Patescibacteria group bacterium]